MRRMAGGGGEAEEGYKEVKAADNEKSKKRKERKEAERAARKAGSGIGDTLPAGVSLCLTFYDSRASMIHPLAFLVWCALQMRTMPGTTIQVKTKKLVRSPSTSRPLDKNRRWSTAGRGLAFLYFAASPPSYYSLHSVLSKSFPANSGMHRTVAKCHTTLQRAHTKLKTAALTAFHQ